MAKTKKIRPKRSAPRKPKAGPKAQKQAKLKKMAKKDLKRFKELLLKMRSQVGGDLSHITENTLNKSARDATGDLSGYSYHMADMASDDYDRDFSLSRATAEQRVLYSIDEALKRIEDGSYGNCLQCRKEIARKRLAALPQTELCIDCQKTNEGKMTPRFARVLLFSAALCVYAADRVAKLIALQAMSPGQSVGVIPGVFHITLVFNSGAAFGLLRDRAVFFIPVSAFIITCIVFFAVRHRGMPAILAISLGLILGGSLGNLVDRVTFGHVIDFFDFRVWPVFNIADSAITAGAGLLGIYLLRAKMADHQVPMLHK